jgi:predicted metal-dependent phosphoesterase TrpH
LNADQTSQTRAQERSLVDLHAHSICSDGTQTPAELVQEAKRRGLAYLSLTDHDTVEGLPEAIAEGDRLGVTIVPGVELSAERNGKEAHMLGYFVDDQNEDLLRDLAEYSALRPGRIEQMVEKLRGLGIKIELDRVREIAGPGTIGRPHVARALVEIGEAEDVKDAFDKYIASGRPGFVPRQKINAEQAIRTILRGNGLPVLAHPYSTKAVEETLDELVPLGLVGLEVYYGEYTDQQRDELRQVAEKWNLIPTGGSDWHGAGARTGRELGGPFVPIESVERLQAVTTRRRALK